MANIQLTRGIIGKAMRDEEVPAQPIIQILGFKKISAQGGQDRYRLHVSDGEFSHSFAMLATQLNHLVHDNVIEQFTVVKVEKMVCNTMNNKRIMIILQLDVVAQGRDVGAKIGNPVSWGETPHPEPTGNGTNGRSAPAPTAAPTPAPAKAMNAPSGSSFYGSNSNNKSMNGGGKPQQSPKSQRPPLSNQELAGSVIPIRDINPYANRVTIRARVVNKGEIKTWSNSRGEGKLFSMEMLDDSGEIRMTGFNQSVDQYYDMIEVNHVYYISRFSVKNANKSFNSTAHDYELSFTNDTQVIPCLEDDSDVPTLSYNFVTIENIENVEAEKTIDVVGVCKHYSDCQTIVSRNTGKELKKREITLIDQTCKEINLTIWGKTAEDFCDDSQPIIAVKAAKVSDFNGKSLSLLQSSALHINPDISEAHVLRGWFDKDGHSIISQSLSGAGRVGGGGPAPFKLAAEANEVTTVDMEKGDYFMSKVTLMAIKRDNAVYKACNTDKCNKKVMDLGNGMYRCEKCSKETPNYKSRLMLNCNFADFTDNFWATAFQDHGESILGDTSEKLGDMFDNRSDEFDAVIKEALFSQYIIKFRSRMENYNNETRKKFTIVDLNKINHAEYCKQLLADIRESSA
ncbi:unnamed protein product [Allacma fusca]|uniref:Replication protein A subunit n=2 Tax=Allacma fusca TaxID=39272 RepID=A0A8J2LLU4_9HEXA|nr:unnamed protein product [Allacma fusca]